VPDDARGYLYLYVGGSSGTCPGIDVVRIKQSDPMDAVYLRRAAHGRGSNSCHDNNVLMNVRGSTIGYAMCAGGNGLAMYKFDMAKPADEGGTPESPGGVANPTLAWTQAVTGVSIGHSGSFTYDGRVLIFGHEPGGGTNAECDPNDTVAERTLFFFDPETGTQLGGLVRDGNGSQPGRPRLQTSTENCTWHNFNVVPTYKGYYAVSGNYEAGISVIDFSNPAAATEIAFADPAEFSTSTNPTSGNWSTHFYNGKIYESDIRRGLITWNLDHDSMRRVRNVDLSNPQTQTASFEQDLEGPAISIAARRRRSRSRTWSTAPTCSRRRARRCRRRCRCRWGRRRRSGPSRRAWRVTTTRARRRTWCRPRVTARSACPIRARPTRASS
jgi:hypothetical protein